MNYYYVYELINPLDCTVFYVGRGVKCRFKHHWLYINENDYTRKTRIIRKILSVGLEPTVHIVKRFEFSHDAFMYERELIEFHGTSYDNSGILANLTKGGEGGDTMSLKSLDEKSRIYKEKIATEREHGPEWEADRRHRQGVSLAKYWHDNREIKMTHVRAAMKTRDKEQHAIAVSEGWQNRTENDKLSLSAARSAIHKTAWKDPATRERLLNGSRAVSIPTTIITPDGTTIETNSLRGWCTANDHSYSVLDDIRSNRHIPKTNRSKYYNWKVYKND
jgi:hypothetical protein